MIKGVFLEPECFTTLVTSAIEVYNRETNGFLVGEVVERKIRGYVLRVLSLRSAQPFQLEERKPTSVEHANKTASARLIETLSTMNRSVVGGYHSHPFPNDTMFLSKEDVEFIGLELDHLNKCGFEAEQWLELVLSIKRNVYSTKHKEGQTFYGMKDDVGVLIKNGPYNGFLIKMRAHVLVRSESGMSRRVMKIYLPPRRKLLNHKE
jgi:proteasome lid subunit RPN8/RPN11